MHKGIVRVVRGTLSLKFMPCLSWNCCRIAISRHRFGMDQLNLLSALQLDSGYRVAADIRLDR